MNAFIDLEWIQILFRLIVILQSVIFFQYLNSIETFVHDWVILFSWFRTPEQWLKWQLIIILFPFCLSFKCIYHLCYNIYNEENGWDILVYTAGRYGQRSCPITLLQVYYLLEMRNYKICLVFSIFSVYIRVNETSAL